MNYQKICQETIGIAKKAGNFIKTERKKITASDIETKDKNDFVTYVDKTAERLIVDKLKDLLPESGFIAEENSETYRGKKYNWIIDPLDGTTNFIHGLYPHAVSIALQEDNQTVVGVVYEIGFDECFYAWKNGGAYLNGEAIHVSSKQKLSNSLIATGFPYKDFGKLAAFMQSMSYFMQHSHGLRRLGSAATDLAYVACGRFEAFYEYNLSPWDVAAGAFIVEEAGGLNCDFSGGNDYLFGKEIISSNAGIFNEFSKAVIQLMR